MNIRALPVDTTMQKPDAVRRLAAFFGISGEHAAENRLMSVATAFVVAMAMLMFLPAQAQADPDVVSVVVRELPGAADEAEQYVEAAGGSVGERLHIIDAFVADLPVNRISDVMGLATVHSVTRNSRVKLLGWDTSPGQTRNTMDRLVGDVLNADKFWNDGYRGQGIDIALIDSGVAPVQGLTLPGKILNGPDLSFESQSDSTRYLDTYGHGTHLAGIIAGNDGHDSSVTTHSVRRGFLGVAPESRIVSIKVADAQGNTDVSQVIAAIDWVVQHKNDAGMNIRVLNLSFGTDSVQDYRIDPLAYAAEVAWKHGIVVVVAGGNDGSAAPLRNPATDPYVIAVGAIDPNGSSKINDDWQPNFSNCGTTARHVDLGAPGKSVVSLRAPGSTADIEFSGARFDDRFFKGTGTSQSAAFVSGAAALLLSQRPQLTPDQVKAILTSTATDHRWISERCEGGGIIDLGAAMSAATPKVQQTFEAATGLGSLEASRGTMHIAADGVPLTGEQDIMGSDWVGASWSGASWSGASWSAGTWNGASWSGASWSGASWSGASWSGASWSGASWSGASWSGASWSGASWSATGWLTSGNA